MIETRHEANDLLSHPTIQVIEGAVGLLGLLNGLSGVIPSGPKKDWGYISANYKGGMFPEGLHSFELTTPSPGIRSET